MQKRIKRVGGRIVGYGSMGLLGIVMLMALFPIASQEASADEPSIDHELQTSVNTNTIAYIRSSIAIAMSSKIEFDLTPKAKGTFGTSTASLKVNTNNTTGYSVYLQTLDNTSQLNPVNANVSEAISAVTGELTSTNYASKLNSWGYRVGTATAEATYTAIPKAGDAPIVKTTGVSLEDDYDLSFAVAVGTDLPAGVYKNELVASVVANPIEVRSLNDIEFMQDMTSEICTISYIDETKQLVDTRDGKSYWVAKLNDGNCWMVEDLKLTFGSGEGQVDKLTWHDSDLTEGREWVPGATQVATLDALTGNYEDVNAFQAWNVTNTAVGAGWYYGYNTVTAGTGQNATSKGRIATDSICPKGWMLPLAGTHAYEDKGFGKLMTAYSIATNANGIVVLTGEPFYLVNYGAVSIQADGTAAFAITNDAKWMSSVANASDGIYIFLYNHAQVSPMQGWGRRTGFPARCVSR